MGGFSFCLLVFSVLATLFCSDGIFSPTDDGNVKRIELKED